MGAKWQGYQIGCKKRKRLDAFIEAETTLMKRGDGIDESVLTELIELRDVLDSALRAIELKRKYLANSERRSREWEDAYWEACKHGK